MVPPGLALNGDSTLPGELSPDRSPTWILLRGLAREARHWGPLPGLLQQALPQAHVITPDLPGNGRRWRERSPKRIDLMVEMLRTELRAQGLKPPYHLMGLSLGAMVAIDWAHRHPHEVEAAVLMNTSVRPFSPPHHRLLPRNLPALLHGLLQPAQAERWERTILSLTTQSCPPNAPKTQALLQDWVRWHREHPVSVPNILRQLTAAARFRAPAVAPPVRLLLLVGDQDHFVSPRCSEALAQAWGRPLFHHPHAGHDLPVDDAPWVVRQVATWSSAGPRTFAHSVDPSVPGVNTGA